MGHIGPCGLSLVHTYCQVQWSSSSETLVLACPCPQHVTGHSWGQKPPSTRAPVCSVPPLGPGLSVAYSSPAPCPALVVTCAFDPCPPEPLIYTKVSCFQKKKSSKRKKLVTYKGNSITLSEDFSEKLARVAQYTQSDEIWKKKKSNQSQVFYLAKSSFRTEGEKKSFPDKQKLKETITTEPTL